MAPRILVDLSADLVFESLMHFVCATPSLTTTSSQRQWALEIVRAGLVCKAWHSAAKDVWARLDHLAQSEETWKASGLSLERFWLWQYERTRRDHHLQTLAEKGAAKVEPERAVGERPGPVLRYARPRATSRQLLERCSRTALEALLEEAVMTGSPVTMDKLRGALPAAKP